MKEFIKIEGHSNWFLVLRTPNDVPQNLSENAVERISEHEIHRYLYTDESSVSRLKGVLSLLTSSPPDYAQKIKKYGAIIVRPIGSFMLLEGAKITETVFSHDFPIDGQNAEIVICENSEQPEPFWVSYLASRYPGKRIGVINYFSGRSDEFILEQFDKANAITFSTTFTNYDWFEKLLKCYPGDKPIIGFCSVPDNWEEANELAFFYQAAQNVEIVESVNH